MQKRTTDAERVNIVRLYLEEQQSATTIANEYGISAVAVYGLLKRRGISRREQSVVQRKYPLNESFFDHIDAQEKAYFLGFLYADGCNFPERNNVTLSLQERDKGILLTLNSMLQPTKPLQFIRTRSENQQNQYRIVIASAHISNTLAAKGLTKAKTHTITFPQWLDDCLVKHFIRGYVDGDGWIGKRSMSIVGTESLCLSIANILKQQLGVNSYISTRHPDRNNTTRTLEVSGRKKCLKVLSWLYDGFTVCLPRKFERYQDMVTSAIRPAHLCSIPACGKTHMAMGYCKNHYYAFMGGKEKRAKRYKETGE